MYVENIDKQIDTSNTISSSLKKLTCHVNLQLTTIYLLLLWYIIYIIYDYGFGLNKVITVTRYMDELKLNH